MPTPEFGKIKEKEETIMTSRRDFIKEAALAAGALAGGCASLEEGSPR